MKLEKMIDCFYQKYRLNKKTRTYHRVAHQEYLAFVKMKRPGELLSENSRGYVHRDVGYVESFLTAKYAMRINFAKKCVTN